MLRSVRPTATLQSPLRACQQPSPRRLPVLCWTFARSLSGSSFPGQSLQIRALGRMHTWLHLGAAIYCGGLHNRADYARVGRPGASQDQLRQLRSCMQHACTPAGERQAEPQALQQLLGLLDDEVQNLAGHPDGPDHLHALHLPGHRPQLPRGSLSASLVNVLGNVYGAPHLAVDLRGQAG